MTDSLPCPDCGAPYALDDNYCRQCGMYLVAVRNLPATTTMTRALERPRAALPAPVAKVAAAVAIGTALQVTAGLAGRYLARQAARGAVEAVKPKKRARRPEPQTKAVQQVQPAPADPMRGASAVSETLLIRRVWIRRD
jgi:hypothetical protein